MDLEGGYYVGVAITRVIIFIVCYIYAIATYGFLLGVGLGWLPSLIIAYLVSWLWPLIAVIVGIAIILIAWSCYPH